MATRPSELPDTLGVANEDAEPCPSCGEGLTPRVRIGSSVIPMLCEECQERALREDEERERREQRDLLFGRSGIALAGYADWTFESAPRDNGGLAAITAVLHWKAKYLGGTRRNLILVGGVGGGKTGLAVALVRSLIFEHGVEAKFVVWRDLLHTMVETIRQKVPFEDASWLHRVPVLVLDDLGAERPTDFARNELSVLVERRKQRGLPIVVTSNYDADALARRLGHDDPVIGQRIVSRLVEDATQHRVAAPDRRKPNKGA